MTLWAEQSMNIDNSGKLKRFNFPDEPQVLTIMN